MKILPFLIVIIEILLTNYSYSQSNIQDSNLTFQEYFNSLPTINFPFKISCDNNIYPFKGSISNGLIRKYGIKETLIYGKFKTSGSYAFVIYLGIADEFVPIIKISDNYGNSLDSLTLLQNCGGNEDCYYGSSWAEITSAIEITIKDTIKTCNLDTLDKVIPGSEKIETQTRRFVVDNNGKLVQFNK